MYNQFKLKYYTLFSRVRGMIFTICHEKEEHIMK